MEKINIFHHIRAQKLITHHNVTVHISTERQSVISPFAIHSLTSAAHLYRVSNGLENYDLKKGECGTLKALQTPLAHNEVRNYYQQINQTLSPSGHRNH